MKNNFYEKNNSTKNDSRKKIGNAGELRAKNFLINHGYEIVATNFRHFAGKTRGEIDIIATKGKFIIFVEVKTLLLGNIEILAQELNSKKQKRIIETAKYFLSIHRKYNNSFVRFDVVVIDMPGFPPEYHIENVFAEFS